MQPSTRGMVVLTAAVALWSCSSDPTESFRGEEKIVANPVTVFVNQGATKFVTVQLVDEQGSQVDTDFEVQNIGSGITVERDTAFLPTNNGGHLETSARFIVGGVDPVASSFEVTGGGVTDTVQVLVVPTGAGIPVVTVSSVGATANDPAVLTVAPPFFFFPDSGISTDGGAGIVVSRAPDNRSITVLPPPGSTTTAAVSVSADYLPTVPLASTTDVPLTIPEATPTLAGADAPATAPEIILPGGVFAGGTYAAATCGGNSGVPCQLYKVVVPDAAVLDVSAETANGTDVGIYFLSADGATDVASCDDHGSALTDASGAVEHCEVELAAGTYLAGVVNFAPFYDPPEDVLPDWTRVEIHAVE